MITNESSPLLTPLPNEPGGVPEPGPSAQTPQVISPDNPPWGSLKAILALSVSIACLLFVPLIIVLPYLLYIAFSSGMPPPEILGKDKTFLLLSIIGVIPAHAITVAAVWAIVTNWGRYPFLKTVGFEWPKSLGRLKGIILSSVIAGVLLVIGAVVTSIFGGGKTDLEILIESSYRARVATAFLAVFTAPFVEELVFRGVLYPAFQRALGVGWSVAIVSALFAGVHYYQYKNNIAVIAVITLLSVTLTLARAITGRMMPSFWIHLVFNGVQTAILLIQPFLENADKAPPTTVPALVFTPSFVYLIRAYVV